MRELDRHELGSAGAFSSWLYAWKARWLAGERIRVVIARDNSHALVLEDPEAPEPSRAAEGQLQLPMEGL